MLIAESNEVHVADLLGRAYRIERGRPHQGLWSSRQQPPTCCASFLTHRPTFSLCLKLLASELRNCVMRISVPFP